MVETVISVAIVVVAIVFLGRRVSRGLGAGRSAADGPVCGGGCAGCPGADASTGRPTCPALEDGAFASLLEEKLEREGTESPRVR